MTRRKSLVAAVIAIVVCLFAYIYFLQPSVRKHEVQEYIKAKSLPVGTQLIKGRQQVYFSFKNKRTYITKDDQNHIGPKSSGRYVVWQEEAGGQSQVVLHDLKTGANVQLSLLRNNTVPSLDGSRVAWQGWTGKSWAIYYFNGAEVNLISQGYAAIRPFVKGKQVLFAQQVDPVQDIWQTVLYNGQNGLSTVVAEGTASQAAWPRFSKDGTVRAGIEGSGAYY